MTLTLLNVLPTDWKEVITEQLSDSDLKKLIELQEFLKGEEKAKTLFPPKPDRFKAFHACPLKECKVVIIGQDPYHGDGQAMGLSFSVPKDTKLPPSLKNIFKELANDLSCEAPKNGDLSSWASQGVLLLNNVLTVEKAKAGSHQKKGWEIFTQAVLKVLNKKEHLVFILWGSPAQKTAKVIDGKRHLLIKSVHPSPLSAYRGFFGSRPFSKCNKYLESHKKSPIRWSF